MAQEKFTKADIIDSLYQKTGMSPREIRTIMDLFINEVKSALLRQQVIELRGFGTFELKVRKGRPRARNPKTGEAISIRSHGTVIFRPGRELKQAAWNISDTTPENPPPEGPVFEAPLVSEAPPVSEMPISPGTPLDGT